ncbi:hypothetical protein ABG067_003567 [Albugo candida]
MGCNQSTAREPETAEITVPSVEQDVVDAGTKTAAHIEDPLESTDRVDPLEQNSVVESEDVSAQIEEKEAASETEHQEPRNETEEIRDEEEEVEAPTSTAHTEEMKTFRVSGHTIMPKDVVYYVIEGPQGAFNRRYNDFKNLYGALKSVADLPSLPSSFPSLPFTSKLQHAKIIKSREERFETILNAIAKDSTIYESDAFQRFLSDKVETPVKEDEGTNESKEVKITEDNEETNEVTEVQVIVEKEVKEHFTQTTPVQEDTAAVSETIENQSEEVKQNVDEVDDTNAQEQVHAVTMEKEEESTDLIVNHSIEETKQEEETSA